MIHHDSPDSSASGFEILYHYKDVQNIRIAQSIISKQTIMTLRTETHKQQDAKVMRLFGNGNRSLENILIEIGFISNKGDVEKMTTKSTEIANEIAEGIKKYINEK